MRRWLAAGGEFSVGDIAVAAGFRSLGYIGLEPNAAKHPKTAAWYERVKARESWKAVAALEAKVLERVLAPAT